MLNVSTKLTHPAGLKTLFFAELWERFGFYCLQALLVLYLIKVFLFSDAKSYALFSAFSALIYATPVIGGFIADKLLGYRKSILLGGYLYLAGYLLLAIPHNPYFHIALGLIIWGNGFFKSCVSTLVGTLYEENDPRRDSGFTLFYMGINIGSFLAPIVCTFIAVTWGWNYGFGSAGIGMLIGIATCLNGFKQFGEKGLSPNPDLLTKRYFPGITNEMILYCGIFILALFTSLLIHYDTVVNTGLIIFSVLTLFTIFIFIFKYPLKERKRLLALIILILFATLFWAFYTQMFLSVVLFLDRNVDRHFFYWNIPASAFQSIEPLGIILFSPLLAKLWMYLEIRKISVSISVKFALGFVFVSIAFFMLALGSHFFATAGIIAAGWIILYFFLQTIGELSLSPIGLSAVTQLSPPNLVAMMMGTWFLSISAGYAIAGKMADLTSIPQGLQDPVLSNQIYGIHFFYFGLMTSAIALLIFLLKPLLDKLMERKDKLIVIENTVV